MIRINVRTPTTVVNIPVFLDFVQPDNEIRIDNEINPIINAVIPIILGKFNS